jgi:hypothetical protein
MPEQKGKKVIPPEDWIPEVPLDAADWLDLPYPKYEPEDETKDGGGTD